MESSGRTLAGTVLLLPVRSEDSTHPTVTPLSEVENALPLSPDDLPRITQRGSAATARNKKMADKKIRAETSGPRFHLLVPHFLVEVF